MDTSKASTSAHFVLSPHSAKLPAHNVGPTNDVLNMTSASPAPAPPEPVEDESNVASGAAQPASSTWIEMTDR